MKVRQKHSVSFSELVTDYEKSKTTLDGKNGQKDFLGFFDIFVLFYTNFPRNGNGSK
jgi:hypothetical protein